jgi:hypothetical protein
MKKLNLNIAMAKRFCFDIILLLFAYILPFFACAKKGTKKAQPILMLTQFSAEHFLCQNRH